MTAGFFLFVVVDCGEVLSHAARLVFGAGVVDAAADADVEPSDERRAVGDAENAHRRGQVLRGTLFSGLVAHAVECARKVDEGFRIAQTPFVVLEDVVARKAEQQEFLGRDVAVDRDVGGSGHRVRAVETVQTGDEEAQTEADVGRVVGTGGDAPVDLFLERAVHVRTAVVVDDPADEALALGGRRERRRVGGLAARPRFGRADTGQSLLSRRKIVFRGVGGLGRCRKYRQQQADS